MTPISIRPATKADAPAITALLNHFIAQTTTTFIIAPHTVEERELWFEQRDAAHPAIAVDLEQRLVAWGALSLHNPREGYRHSADVSVYVHPDFQRRGIGRAIVIELIRLARAAGHHTLIADCCTESVGSIALHESLGFERAGRHREVGRKFDRWLDVVSLQLML